MNKEYINVKQLYVVSKCDCGGLFRDPLDNRGFPTSPPKRNYKCSKCGKVQMLSKDDWPHLEFEEI